MAQWGYSWHHWAFKTMGKWTWDSTYYFDLGEDIDNYDCPTVTSCLRMDKATRYARWRSDLEPVFIVIAVSRVYPAAIAGTGIYYHFIKETSEAVLVFLPDGNITQVGSSSLLPSFYSQPCLVAIYTSAANRFIGEVVQSRRRPLLGPSPG